MAREKVSNEIIAQVLTQSVSNLEKALKTHQGRIEQLTKEPVPINTEELREIYGNIVKNNRSVEQNINQYRADLQKVYNPLKLARKVLFYAIIFTTVVLGGVIGLLYFMNRPTAEEKLKAKFLDEVFFGGDQKDNRVRYYEEWKKAKN